MIWSLSISPHHFHKFFTFTGLGHTKKMLSSAKGRWDTEGLVRKKCIPVIFSSFSAWRTVHRINRKRDQGSPWRKPLSWVIFPLVLTIHEDLIFNRCDTLHDPLNPCGWETQFSITARMKSHSILLYALIIYVLISIIFLLLPDFFLRAWNDWAIMILHEIWFPAIKNDWVSKI